MLVIFHLTWMQVWLFVYTDTSHEYICFSLCTYDENCMPYISIQNILHRKLMLHRNHAITLSDLIIAHSVWIWIVKTTRVYLEFQKIRFDVDKLSFHEKFHFEMHMWEKRFFKDPRFQNTKSWETVLEWLSEWKCTHMRSLFRTFLPLSSSLLYGANEVGRSLTLYFSYTLQKE